MRTTSDNQKRIIYILTVIALALGISQVLMLRELANRPAREEPKPKIVEEEPKIPEVSRGTVAIIIDDFGYRNDAVSERFLKLDADLTYAVIPGHEHSRSFSSKAEEEGYEVIIHMPLESRIKTKGEREYILETNMTSAELESRINKVLDHLPEAVGMNNHQGSKASEDSRVMGILATLLKSSGKYFIDSRTTTGTVAELTMRNYGVPTNRRHVFLDNQDDADMIKIQLEELFDKAETMGTAIGIGHAKLNTIAVLEEEIPKRKAQGFDFVFASEVAN